MTSRRNGDGGWVLAVLAVLTAAGPAVAQVTDRVVSPASTPLPGITPSASSALPVPPAPVIVLPTASPSAAAPTPRATPTPKIAPSVKSTPRVTAGPSTRATPSPAPVAEPSAAPVVATSPAPAATTSVVPAAQPVAQTDVGAGSIGDDWWLAVAAIGVASLAIGWVVLRRRRARRAEPDEWDGNVAGDVDPAAVPRARLAISFRPIRAGLNLLSAISENEIVVANVGAAAAENIRLLTQLTSAHAGQDAELAAIHAAPIGRPAVPAFNLAPGEKRTIVTVAALPRDALRTLTAGGRPMFVPIVAVNITYATVGIDGQLAQAFAVGVERVDSPKLAPFWLDAPPRTIDQVAARPHAAALER